MMKELTNFPILLNAIFNITSGIRNIQSPFSSPDTALNAGASPPAAAVTAAAESILPEILHATIGDITSAQWASLNASVGGRLHADGAPYARACFDQYDGDGSSTADQEACQELQAGYLNEKYRLSHFGSAMLTQWETCQATGEGCLLNWMNPKDGAAFSSPKTCHQGIVSRYYIDVREPSDVSAAFDFVRSTGVRLVVKNTGHDYMGRSTAPDSLTLWTRNLQGITYNPSFRPEACEEISATSAITVGAGTVFGQVYEFAETNNITVVGGTDRTVGASGGWVQGGGHSLLSPKLGLGADRALQFKVVVPSGEYLTANACQNSDLFFALRGGGGGTFGVVTETTFKAEPTPTSIRVAKITFPAVPANWQSVIKIGVQNGIRLSEDGWSGVIGAGLVTFINTQLSLEEAKSSFKPYSDFAESVNGTFIIDDTPSWYQFFEKYIGANPVGLPGAPASRLVPKSHFETADSRAALEAAIIDGTTASHFKQIHMSCPTHYQGDTENTSVTPAWRDCIWSVAVGTFWNHATTVEGVKTAYETSTEAIRRLKELTPESGTYASEGDMHESDYEQSFWGSNYPRLLSIKQKYDPQGILDCWHCIGWKGVNDGRYSCMI